MWEASCWAWDGFSGFDVIGNDGITGGVEGVSTNAEAMAIYRYIWRDGWSRENDRLGSATSVWISAQAAKVKGSVGGLCKRC